MGDHRVYGSIRRKIGAEVIPHTFGFLFGFAFNAFRIVFVTEFPGRVVAVFLERLNLAGEAAEDGKRFGEFFGSGGELLASFRFDKEFREMRGGELQADFGKLAGVVLAQIFQEIFLEEPGFDGAVLFEAPFFVAATRFPVGNVAARDVNADFAEGVHNFVVRKIVAKHPVDYVALEMSKAGDFAVAGQFALRGLDCWMIRRLD